jgi:parallel beta-helix repeat protein
VPPADPATAINVRQAYGTDDGAVRRAVAAARSAGKSLYFATGTYRYDGFLILDGVSAFGDGAGSVLEAMDPAESAVILRGGNVSLRALKVTAPGASKRLGPFNAGGVYIDHVNGFTVEGVTVSRVQSAGIIVLGASNGTISGNLVSGSYSDGIHMTGGAHDIVVKGNQVRDTGDDMIAVVSYLDDGVVCSSITIVDNDVRGQSWGRGISVVGGRDVTVQRNTIDDTSGAGVLVNSDGSYGTYGTTGVKVLQNTISRTDRNHIHHGGIHVEGWPGQLVQGTVVSGNTISDTAYRGVVVGPQTVGTRIEGNTIQRTANAGVFVWGGADPSVVGNRIDSTANYGVYVTRDVTGRLSILDNTLRNVNTSRQAAIDVVHVEAGSALTSGEIRRTIYTLATGDVFDRLVECANPQVVVADNRTA